MSNSSSSSTGIGFFGLLGIVFIILKLTHVINWPWVWVLAPIWGAVLLWLIIMVIILVGIIFVSSKGW